MSFLCCLYWNLGEESVFQCLQLRVSLLSEKLKVKQLYFLLPKEKY